MTNYEMMVSRKFHKIMKIEQQKELEESRWWLVILCVEIILGFFAFAVLRALGIRG